jgi:hypothetical protein
VKQVLEQCSTSDLQFGILTAPPLLFRPIFLGGDSTAAERDVFLGPNLINNLNAGTSVHDPEAWEKFFHQLIWVTFCVWIKAVAGPTNKMKENEHWEEWAVAIERTLRPGEQAARKHPPVLRSAMFTLRRTIGVIEHFLWSMAFKVTGPVFPFHFMRSFSVSQFQIPSVLTYP